MEVKVDKVSFHGEVRASAWDKNGKPKKLFQPNRLWEFLKKTFNVDIQIPFFTGHWSYEVVKHNDLTTLGKAMVSQGMITTVTHMAIGIGTPGATGLGSEIASGGGERAAATTSQVTTTTTNDTAQWLNLFVFTDDFLVTEEGLFNGADPGDDMFSSWTMAGLDMKSGDSLQLTHRVKVEQAA